MNKNPTAETRVGKLLLVVFLLWAAIVFYCYFFSNSHPLTQVLPVWRKVFDLSAFPAVSSSTFWQVQAESLWALLTAFFVSVATWVLGRRLRQWLGLSLLDSWIGLAIDFGLGIFLLNLFWLGTGLERLWFKPLWITAGVTISILVILEVILILKRRRKLSLSRELPSGGYLFLSLTAGFYFVFSLFQNLAPETFYDSMVYHLAVPSYWLLNHGIMDFPTNFFSNYPFGAELYFLNGFIFQGTESAKMLHVVSLGVCALLAGGWAREMAGSLAGWLTLGLTLTFPLLTVNVWTTQVEGFLSLAVVLFIYAFSQFVRKGGNQWTWALLSGLFLGLALATKYTALLALGSVLVVLAVQNHQIFKKDHWKHWLVMVFGSFPLLGPWILKSLIFTGNPFFPYLMSYFSGRHLPPVGYERLLEEQRARVALSLLDWLHLPWTLTMATPDSYNFCGPFCLALAPLLFLFRLRHPALKFLVWVILLFMTVGFALTHILRFVVPDFILLFILLGTVLAGGNKPKWGKGAAWIGGISAIACFSYLGAISDYYYSATAIWSGRQTRLEYLTGKGKVTPYALMAQWISDHTLPEARLLIAGDARGLYYDRFFATNSVFDEQFLAKYAKEESGAEGIGRRLRKMGIDFLVVNGVEGLRVSADYHHYDLTREEWQRLDDFIQRGTEAVYLNNLRGVYRLLPNFQEAPEVETKDLLLFFSKPATDFVKALGAQKLREAEEAVNKALELYPFSKTWIQQKMDFDANFRASLHG